MHADVDGNVSRDRQGWARGDIYIWIYTSDVAQKNHFKALNKRLFTQFPTSNVTNLTHPPLLGSCNCRSIEPCNRQKPPLPAFQTSFFVLAKQEILIKSRIGCSSTSGTEVMVHGSRMHIKETRQAGTVPHPQCLKSRANWTRAPAFCIILLSN